MADDCIFCSIIDGEIPAHVVAETEETLAFLDANPLAPGHTLVVPTAHRERLDDLGDEADAVYDTLHRVVPAVEAAVDADATTVAFNNGEAAGQEVPHVHGHVIPRFDGDGGHPIHAVAGDRPDLSDAELEELAADIGGRLG
jgi:histidine triad (HIT) family protein